MKLRGARVLLAALLLAVCAFALVLPWWERLAWREAPGTVIAKEFPRRRHALLTIEYAAGSARHTAQVPLAFFEASFAEGGGYEPGTPVNVRYHPGIPGQVELEGWGKWQIPLFAVVLIVVALFQTICSPAPFARLLRRL